MITKLTRNLRKKKNKCKKTLTDLNFRLAAKVKALNILIELDLINKSQLAP